MAEPSGTATAVDRPVRAATVFSAGKEQLARGAGWLVIKESDVELLRLVAECAEMLLDAEGPGERGRLADALRRLGARRDEMRAAGAPESV